MTAVINLRNAKNLIHELERDRGHDISPTELDKLVDNFTIALQVHFMELKAQVINMDKICKGCGTQIQLDKINLQFPGIIPIPCLKVKECKGIFTSLIEGYKDQLPMTIDKPEGGHIVINPLGSRLDRYWWKF